MRLICKDVSYIGLTLQVPGGYQDSLSKNTKLGKALDEAVNELDTLGELVILFAAAWTNLHGSAFCYTFVRC